MSTQIHNFVEADVLRSASGVFHKKISFSSVELFLSVLSFGLSSFVSEHLSHSRMQLSLLKHVKTEVI